jgi:pimeloyl-ACP methyl ester carboxylesterase
MTNAASKHQSLGWLKRLGLGLSMTLLVVAGAGFTYQTVATANDQHNLPPPGQRIDVGGFKMHIVCQGEGSPTVVLEALAVGYSSYWSWVQSQVSKGTRVCAYDRAGFGWSDPDPQPESLNRTAQNLHTLLQKANLGGPYVLVGHSKGGLYVREYAALYPTEVVGLVLLDSSHPDQFQIHPDWLAQDTAMLNWIPLMQGALQLGIGHAYFAAGGELDFKGLPPEAHAVLAAASSSPNYWARVQVDMKSSPDIFKQAQTLGPLGHLPLLVISRSEALTDGWGDLQNELVTLSTNSVHVTIPGASHTSLIFNPAHALQVSAAILTLVDAIRTGQPLTGIQ